MKQLLKKWYLFIHPAEKNMAPENHTWACWKQETAHTVQRIITPTSAKYELKADNEMDPQNPLYMGNSFQQKSLTEKKHRAKHREPYTEQKN